MVCLLLAACSSGETKTDSSEEESSTFTYESEQGPVEVPKEPKRIVALTNGPNVISLEGVSAGVTEAGKGIVLGEERNGRAGFIRFPAGKEGGLMSRHPAFHRESFRLQKLCVGF